ncbi:glycosyltransferase [Pseudanabaena biceps]|nr:glycosyltransferase [Pseudanabaena biceps]
MSDNVPLISVVLITYQHEKYIAEAIQSILDQTFENFELLIVNDGSTDRSDEIIRNFTDSRITYIYQENQGPSAATNKGILASRGKYIALMSGDDVCYHQRLEVQYQYLSDSGKKIVFSWVDFIDGDSQPFVGQHFAQSYFNHPNRTQSEILNWFFMKGNYLCAVTALIEKRVLLEAGLFNLSSIQIQDFAMWIKLVKKYDICIIEEQLVKYRILPKAGNLSGNPANSIRIIFELHQIYRNLLDDIPIEIFKSSFIGLIKNPQFVGDYEYELEKAFLHLNHSAIWSQSIGAEKLFSLLQNENSLIVAKSKYNFDLPKLYELNKDVDLTNIKSQLQLQYTQSELERSQSQLQYTQSELERSQSQLQYTQSELERLQSQLEQTQSELNRSQSQLQYTQSELERSQSIILTMEDSKFWKLRKMWFLLKNIFPQIKIKAQ